VQPNDLYSFHVNTALKTVATPNAFSAFNSQTLIGIAYGTSKHRIQQLLSLSHKQRQPLKNLQRRRQLQPGQSP
jgi:hypothetical protein